MGGRIVTPGPNLDLLALEAALQRLAEHDPLKARLVEPRYFAGLTGDQAARATPFRGPPGRQFEGRTSMSFLSHWRRVFTGKVRRFRPSGRRLVARPRLEVLEDRTLPTGLLSVPYMPQANSGYFGSVSVPPPDLSSAGPDSVVAADFNHDGRPDIAVANGITNNVSILLNNGNGTFGVLAPPPPELTRSDFSYGPNASYTVGTDPGSLVVGDFNGDGFPDLAVLNRGQGNLAVGGLIPPSVSVLLGNGSGGFSAPTTIPMPISILGSGPPSALVVGDFIHDVNHPGNQDLAVLSDGAPTGFVSILEDNGNGLAVGGGFTLEQSYSVGVNPISAVVGDFNGDGSPDLAVLNQGSGGFSPSVSVLLGNGIGSGLSTAVQYTLAYRGVGAPTSLAIGDLSGNGHLDIVVAGGDALGGALTLLPGNGRGGFSGGMSQTPGIFGLPGDPSSVVVGDFNGDGIPDLALGNFGNSVTMLLGKGDFTFAPPAEYTVGEDPSSFAAQVAMGDFNGDGFPDLVATNPLENSVGVLLNQTVATTTSLTASPNSAVYGQSVTFTATVSSASGVPTGRRFLRRADRYQRSRFRHGRQRPAGGQLHHQHAACGDTHHHGALSVPHNQLRRQQRHNDPGGRQADADGDGRCRPEHGRGGPLQPPVRGRQPDLHRQLQWFR
jgi:hypothetical protein